MLARRGHPLLVGVLHDLRQVVRVQRVEDVEEVLPRRTLVLRVLVRKVRQEDGVLLELGIERLHRQLVVVRDLDRRDGRLLVELLLPGEDVLQEVLVDEAFGRQVELEAVDQNRGQKKDASH